jgi:hypothetical protein
MTATMTIEPVASATFELWWADEWLADPFPEPGGEQQPEPLRSAVKLDTFTSRFGLGAMLTAWQTIAAARHGPGALMVLNERGVGVLGPYPVERARARAV